MSLEILHKKREVDVERAPWLRMEGSVVSNTTTTASVSISPTIPYYEPGDAALLMLLHEQASGGLQTITPPSADWLFIGQMESSNLAVRVYGKKLTAAEPSPTISRTLTGAPATAVIAAFVNTYANVADGTFWEAVDARLQASGTSVDIPSITTLGPNRLGVSMIGLAANVSFTGAQTGSWIERQDTGVAGSGARVASWDLEMSTAGAQQGTTATTSSTTSGARLVTFALIPPGDLTVSDDEWDATHEIKGGAAIHPTVRNSSYYNVTQLSADASVASTIVTGRLTFHPILIGNRTLFDRIGVMVGTAAAVNFRPGVWKARASDLFPGELVVDGGSISMNTTGIVEATIGIELEPGLYWTGGVSDGTPSLRCVQIGDMFPLLGLTTAYGLNSNVYRAFTFGALGDETAQTHLVQTNSVSPYVHLRKS